MSSRRTMMMVAAVVAAAFAGVAIFTYLGDITERKAAGEEQITVYVVPRTVQRLEAGSAVKFETEKIPQRIVPQNAITDADTTKIDEIKKKVAVISIPENSILTDNLFVDKSQIRQTGSQRLLKDYVAVSISLDQVHGLGGILQPGDYVNVLETITPKRNNPDSVQYTVPFFQKAFVLYIGDQPAPQPGDPTTDSTKAGEAAPAPVNTGIITLELPPSAAARLVAATGAADFITLNLVNPDYSPINIPIYNDDINRNGFQEKTHFDNEYLGKSVYMDKKDPGE